MQKENFITGIVKALRQNSRLRMAAIATLLLSGALSTEAAPREFKDSARISFRQSKFEIDTLYNGNRDSIDFFRRRLATLKRENPFAQIRKVTVVGSASPEGSIALNKN
ncbi:MAG: hypothetical protein K2H15_00510, partial [Muribaculaceae bacterium]|nr:hypothetical protein [Muribaculaceae bacterium]